MEQYNIVVYLEHHLRNAIQELIGKWEFWGYEKFLRSYRSKYVIGGVEVGLSIGVALVMVTLIPVLWPLSAWDLVGLVFNAAALSVLVLLERDLAKKRHEWEKSYSIQADTDERNSSPIRHQNSPNLACFSDEHKTGKRSGQ